jgi:organic anion transporter 4A
MRRLCWAATLQGLIVNGFVNVVITTIEKRYNLSSTDSGLIVGAYDISGLIFLIPVSYLGETRSKPKFIAFGVLLLAFGSLTFSLPSLMSGRYRFTKSDDSYICHKSSLDSSFQLFESKESDSLSSSSNYFYVFIIAMIVNGAATASFYTLGCTYIEENTSSSSSSLYLGVYYTMAIFGPALGYIIGGQLLQIYVDFGVDASKLGLTPSSSVWVGNWYLGFMVSAIVCFIIIIPISGLPRKLPNFEENNATKLVETHKNVELSEAVRPGFGIKLKDLPVSLKILLKNGPFVLINIAASSDSLIIAGLSAFAPKITEQQFGLTASFASLLVGIVALSAAGGGNFLGSYLLKRFDMKFTSIMKMCIGISFISLGFTTAFAISCPNGSFAGLTTLYNNESLSKLDSFKSSCNSDCFCSRTHYDPICGTDNIQYYSPCYAACQQSNETPDLTTYSNCACISSSKVTNTSFQAERRRCGSDCNLLPAFLVLQFCLIFCTFLMGMPSLTSTMR